MKDDRLKIANRFIDAPSDLSLPAYRDERAVAAGRRFAGYGHGDSIVLCRQMPRLYTVASDRRQDRQAGRREIATRLSELCSRQRRISVSAWCVNRQARKSIAAAPSS